MMDTLVGTLNKPETINSINNKNCKTCVKMATLKRPQIGF